MPYIICNNFSFKQEGRRLGYMSMGVPLVAGSPVRHEPAGSLALEVTAYQPPWKALSDFALHADLDRAPHHSAAFQQLVNQVISSLYALTR